MSLLIINNDNFHFEIIESIVIHYNKILSIHKNEISTIILKIANNINFIEYLQNKYPFLIINKNIYFGIKYLINVSIYKKDYHLINKMANSFYISHEVDDELKKYSNVFFTTPLCNTSKYMYFTELPFKNKKQNSEIPIFIIQGEFKRRNWNLLKKILERKYTIPYKIKILGNGAIPITLKKLFTTYNDIVEIKQDLNFQDYHREFLDCYGIIPCISKTENAAYYLNKLTSSINYGLGYDLWFLVDKDLQEIYNLKKSKIYTDNIDDIFESLLHIFAQKKI